MLAIDTNVLVRLLVSDNPAQSKASPKLFASEDIFIPDTVLLETEKGLARRLRLEPRRHMYCLPAGLRPAQRNSERRATYRSSS